MASLEAAYHPDFQQYSLGYFTMLLELEFGQRNGLGWYYPGFYPKGISMFNYKLKPGGVEFFQLPSKKWQPFEELETGDWLLEKVVKKLKSVQALIQKEKVVIKLRYFFHQNEPGPVKKVTDHFVFLEMIHLDGATKIHRLRIGYHIFEEKFEVFGQDLTPVENEALKPKSPLSFLANGPFQFLGSTSVEKEVFSILP